MEQNNKPMQRPQGQMPMQQQPQQEQPKVYLVPRAVSIEEMFNTINDKLDYLIEQQQKK